MSNPIVIDDDLMRSAMRASQARTEKEAVDLGLRTLIRLDAQRDIKSFRGRLEWQGDLDVLRGRSDQDQ